MRNINKYQLQQELKKELHNRKQDSGKYFFYDDYITIEYNDQFDFIYADWRGYQTEHSVMAGCEKILEACQAFHCPKVLSDSTNVAGIWPAASAWVSTIRKAGVKHFAWVYSSGNMSSVSTDESIRNGDESTRNADGHDLIKTFDDVETAKAWLKEKR
jgi:hypothetical protein